MQEPHAARVAPDMSPRDEKRIRAGGQPRQEFAARAAGSVVVLSGVGCANTQVRSGDLNGRARSCGAALPSGLSGRRAGMGRAGEGCMRSSRRIDGCRVRGAAGPSVERAAARWLARAVATARNAKGRALAATRVRRWLVPQFGRRPLRGLTGDDVRGYRLALEAHGLAPQTVVHLMSDLRALLLWAVAEGLLERSPFPRRALPRVPEVAPRGLADAEVARLVALPEPWGFVVRLLIGTGLRWAEACRARRDHVREGMLEVSRTKSGRVRRVPLSPVLLAEVRARAGPLVPFAAGSPGSFTRTVRRRSGVFDFHPHRCRHTFAMRWLAAGGSLPVLQELLGHRELSTTMRYARVTDDLVRREAERVRRRQQRRSPSRPSVG